MKAYLIDPIQQTVEQVEYSGDYKQIYQLIGADCFDLVHINEAGDAVFVDDNGLLRKDTLLPAFRLSTYPSVLAGRGLVLGIRESDGESCEPRCTLDWLHANVEFGYLRRDGEPRVSVVHVNDLDELLSLLGGGPLNLQREDHGNVVSLDKRRRKH